MGRCPGHVRAGAPGVGRVVLASCDAFDNFPPGLTGRTLALTGKLPFDGPPMRVLLHRRSEESFQFTLSFHHALLDGWSVASLLTELFGRYHAHLKGAAAPKFKGTMLMQQAMKIVRVSILEETRRERPGSAVTLGCLSAVAALA